MYISPYVTFYGGCRNAIDFYKSIFDIIEARLSTFEEMPPLPGFDIPDKAKKLILHAELCIKKNSSLFYLIFADSFSLAFEDFSAGGVKDNISIAISDSNEEWLQEIYDKLLIGGKSNMAPHKTVLHNFYGSLIDRFGICWHLYGVPEITLS